jgi:hypothetical protein
VPHGADESTVNSLLTHHAVHYALQHWQRWPIVAVMRELWLWSLWRPAWTVHMAVVLIGHPQWMVWCEIVSFWILVPFAAAGVVVARRRGAWIVPLYVLFGYVALVGLLVVGHLRFRACAELALVLLAAFALDELIERQHRRAQPELGEPVEPLAGTAHAAPE